MEVRLEGGAELYNRLKALQGFIDYLNLDFSEEGVRLRQLDPPRVVLVDMFLPVEIFTKYVGGEKFAVSTYELMKILRYCKKDDAIGLSTGKLNGYNVLNIKIINDVVKHEFSIPILEYDYPEFEVPDLPFTVKVELLCKTIKDIIKKVDMISDTVQFIAKTDPVTTLLIGNSLENHAYWAELTFENAGLLDAEIETNVRSAYSVGYLKDILSPKFSNTDSVVIKFGEEMPIEITVPFRDDGYFKYLLAPRIEW